MSVIHVNKENYPEAVLESEKPVLLEFFAQWCGPCRAMGPVLEEFAAENPGCKVAKVDIDEEPELTERFRVMSVPSLFVIKDGKVVTQSVGAKTRQQLRQMVESVSAI